ncbi:hybrid sensor histidine kinase/response regulator [Rubrivivax gelatinosus]|uniref:histidine kinase n=1 Tax=Rubrivivax gelatinosus (strain NBRC 100245 / IL144) TaxID=983917 RepID=I0HS64_RUBGI|nr:ATP-binding protein [Rubrivivax gelatinosus]BAL95851.1 integral membrane sensor hybrid histidine kinase [Rubrivivax gelatinosus IL144]
MPSISIRSRLLLLVLAVLLPAVAAAALVIARTWAAERAALERNLRDTARALSTVIDREIDQRATIVRVLATARSLENAPYLTPEQRRVFDRQARRAIDGMDGWVELTDGEHVVLSTRDAPDAPPSGASAPDLAQAAAVRPLATSAAASGPHARVVQPVVRDGRVVANLEMTILPEELQRIIDRQSLPPGWLGTILDADGSVVARHPGGIQHAGRRATPDILARLSRDREGFFDSVSLDGVPVRGFFSKSVQGWTYMAAMPQPAIAGSLPPAVLQLGAGALLLLGLAVAGALFVARRIVGPVNSLKEAAARMRAGQPVAHRTTGLAECDDVAAALAEAAESIQHAQADLERQVADAVARTRQAEQRVSLSQRVEALGRLTGGVAHDFNNLLGVISNSAHLIQRRATTPEIQAPVAATLRAVEVGSRLTQHLLRFSGRHPTRPTRIELARYLAESQELIRVVLGKRCELSVTVAPGTAGIHVDSSELELALINLALNARDALPAGGHVWIEARDAAEGDAAELPPGPYVQIMVSDDGSGIDEAIAHRVFEPFFTTKGVGKGTGLGLIQVHGFCAQAGGRAAIASTRGLGTTVTLLLPAAGEDEAGVGPAPAPLPEGGLYGVRVLLVEDNPELADVTAGLLDSLGCRVVRARSPEEALALVGDGRRLDVVLSDVVMPGDMDGIALARELRRCLPQLPVVLISGFSSALQDGHGFPVLAKPCTPEELVRALRQAIDGRRP